MRGTSAAILFCLISAAVITPVAGADALLGTWGSTTFPNFLSGINYVGTGVRGPFFFGPTATAFSGPGLFETVTITAANLGHDFTATAANDPHFNTIVSLVTNGQDDVVGNCELVAPIFSGGGRLYTESWFAHAAFGSGVSDFSGYQINSIVMHIDHATLVSPGSDLNHDGKWTDYNFTRTLRFYGEVPEPAGGLLLPLLTIASAAHRLLRRQRGPTGA